MNLERMKQLRDFLAELPPEKLDMRDWFKQKGKLIGFFPTMPKEPSVVNECGTSACIAGWTNFVFRDVQASNNGISERASELLGLSVRQNRLLFMALDDDGLDVADISNITLDHAVAALDIIITEKTIPSDLWKRAGAPVI